MRIPTRDNFLELIPNNPGVYIYHDANDRIIYVGKAKNLKKRISSYFKSTGLDSLKTQTLVRHIEWLEYIIVNSEHEAFLLENNLIKENKPKYNILLKDDKTYPWICITNEEFPRILFTRRYKSGCGTYYGPFTSKRTIGTILKQIRTIVPHRTCQTQISETGIKAKRYSLCLEYYIKNCGGCCCGIQSKENYLKGIDIVHHILKGQTGILRSNLEREIEELTATLRFEEAESIQKLIDNINHYETKQTIVNPKIGNYDVITILEYSNCYYVNYLQVRNGYITMSKTNEVHNPLKDEPAYLLEKCYMMVAEEGNSECKNLLSNIEFNIEGKTIEVPKKGDKKKLINISLMNCEGIRETLAKTHDRVSALTKLKEVLKLDELPIVIDCIDNSNTLGEFPVSAIVRFRDGRPEKKMYRIFNVKNVTGPNDYETMRDTLTRHFSKLEESLYPNLLLVDGGKGQLHVVLDTLRDLGVLEKLYVAALAERLEEVYVPNDRFPIILDKRSEELKLIQHIRDEAHRFGITRHRKRRDDSMKTSILETIPGIGKETIRKVYTKYSNVEEIKKANIGELVKLIGVDKTERIIKFINENNV